MSATQGSEVHLHQTEPPADLADGSYWIYQYDNLGQVTNGVKYFYDGTLVPGQQFGYGFDDIGNRQQTTAGGDSTGAGKRLANYTVNTLNQITQRDYPGTNDVIGVALATNSVTVNGQTAWRKGEYFWAMVKSNNTASAQWEGIKVISGSFTNSGNLYVPKTPEQFSYDADGNLTNDGHFAYTWDGENRLIAVTNNSGVGPNYGLKFAYDPQGRRIQKMVSTNGVGIYTNKFLYDGWNLIAELKPDNSRLRTYVWGTDLSGSLQGAGGVGGLLEVSYYGAATTNCFPAYDGNGNVMNYVNAADGASVAQFEYDPFLGITRATGPMANLLPFLGSTKYFDWESGLYDYGHRYYGPSFGGWLNKDPLQEKGGLNLYENSRNDLVNRYDALGLLPGFHACTLSSDPPVDTGWQYAGFEPDEDIPAGGSSGTSETTGANLVYKRTITTKYSCCCSRTKYRVQIYGSAYDWIPFQNFILWQGVPGAWPPISGLEDPISAFILDKLTSPIPVNPSASDINNQASSHTPSNSTTGTLAKDSGVPTAWCFW